VEEPPLLLAVQRQVGGVHVQNDPNGSFLVRLEKSPSHQRISLRKSAKHRKVGFERFYAAMSNNSFGWASVDIYSHALKINELQFYAKHRALPLATLPPGV
jgi:hypothetical protein